MSSKTFQLILVLIFLTSLTLSQTTDITKMIQPKVIPFDLSSNEYQRLLNGGSETKTMHSGLVTLLPDSTVGTHNTDEYEEMIVVLQGEGQMMITDGPTMKFKYRNALYCPPHTEHNVKNTGTEPLKYIYIVAKTE